MEEVAENDKIREETLTTIGFTIMRFNDNDVLTAINSVYYQIEEFIKAFELKHIHPLPPPAGDTGRTT